jgi:hypothetical protein
MKQNKAKIEFECYEQRLPSVSDAVYGLSVIWN